VGGKNGVNLDAYKNMVGVFNQPRFVICDLNLLHTLPGPEISNGLAEIVKHALICDRQMLSFIEKNRQKALDLDRETIFRLVADSVDIKSRIVQQDEKEAGERRKLNFGHTIGHAIEKIAQSGPAANQGHGRAVSLGMVAAARFSLEKKMLGVEDVHRITELLTGLGLPVDLDFRGDQVVAAAARDKKKQGDNLHFVFLEALGRARVETIGVDEMNRFIRSIFP
jgi:3-dehydroquinate synthase